MEFFKKNKILLLAILTIIAILIIAGFCVWQKLKVPKEEIAAVINGEKIFKKDFDRHMEIKASYRSSNLKPIPPGGTAPVLLTLKQDEMEYLIKYTLMEQFLRQKSLEVTDAEVDSALEEALEDGASDYGGKEGYKAYITSHYGGDLSYFRFDIKYKLMEQRIINNLTKKQMRGIWLKKFTPFDAPEGFPVPEDLLEKDNIQLDKATNILERAKNGEDFVSLVREFSQDEQSRSKDGFIGMINDKSFATLEPLEKEFSFPSGSVVREAFRLLNEGDFGLYDYPSGYAVIEIEKGEKGI